MLVRTTGAAGEVYGSAGFAEDFPDKCLVTVANPSTNVAFQFTESGADSDSSLGPFTESENGTVSDLPESVKDWNIDVRDDGRFAAE